MDSADHLRLCKVLTIADAAMLLSCEKSSEMVSGVERLSPEQRPVKYEAAKAAIIDALLAGEVEGKMRAPGLDGIMGANAYVSTRWFEEPGHVDPVNSTVDVASLKRWSSDRGDTSNLLFDKSSSTPGYLDPTNTHYAPKLAAAVMAWLAFEGKDVKWGPEKKALEEWLTKHAGEFAQLGGAGLNKTGIGEAATVANWNPTGGRPPGRAK